MPTRRDFLKYASLGVTTALATQACNNITQPGANQGTISVKLGAVSGINSIDVWIPQDLGYFNAAGLNAEVITFQSSAKMRDALIAGEIDFTAQAPLHVYLSRLKGVPLNVVANRRNLVDTSLIVRSDLQSQIKSVADLKGKKVSAGEIGTWSWAVFVKYLRQNGLSDKDVEYVQSTTASTYTLIKSRQVDAAIAGAPDLHKLIKEGAVFQLLNALDPEVHKKYFGANEAMTRAWLSHERVTSQKSEAVKRLVEVANRTFTYMHQTPPEQILQVVGKRFDSKNLDAILTGLNTELKRSVPKDASISQEAYLADQKVFFDTGIIKKMVPYTEGVFDKFAGRRA
ncbi:ABC transporter substrate-binding protein [Nostoc sp. FACHB-87]|uniref:ABC transporter substrate-binding protein n=1 Tax=Nostocales TaxID=1161 RepID=UPI0016899DE4|nr:MULTISPECIES: ABC transporter substrate-binding protein [Nostocales]MBD2298061.1 ABC transporter substrate-binding protein [Nostoc sp. FACHB-190]MBD2454044.1 ABC transporter substrate-binding protein [Nostoc sp. FACHB-87]MBD2476261.1 ABC transporter substrate-binding protein [Anabaena sp. FACHB-83]MBD2492020.1 ABC transporter substrate-binding protein [Aulosira sp. FACHB-615]